MKKQNLVKHLLKIENLLLLLAFISIVSTISFLISENAKFKYVSYEMDYCVENAASISKWDSIRKNNFFANLQKECKPFTYFNQQVEDSLNSFIEVFSNEPEQFSSSDLTQKYLSFHKSLTAIQHQLSLGYIWLISVSLFITLISLISIFENSRHKKNGDAE